MLKPKELLFVLLLCVAEILNAQTVKVIVNNDKNAPVEGAIVQLVKAKDSTLVKSSISGKDGAAEIDNVKKGNYLVYITQLGFESYYSAPVTIDSLSKVISLPVAVLQTKNLNEVVIKDKTPAIQVFADKTVVNVQNNPVNAGSTVFDVIQRSPGIIVEQNDNISLQGKSGVSIMIDGRAVPMSGADLANLLRSMPAESADKIEFITNPSAKYDANGSAGIINIILKKDKRIGANATVYASYGQGIYPKTNDGFSFNQRTKKFNIFGSYNYSYHGSVNIINFVTNFYNGSQFASSTQQNEYLKTPLISHTARLGADFFASDKTTMGVILDFSESSFIPSESTTTYEYDSLNNEKSYNVTSSNSPSYTYNYAANYNLKHTFDSLGRELLVNLDYATYNTNSYQNITTNYYDISNTLLGSPSNLYGYLPGMLDIYSAKADYDGQLFKIGTLGAGIKSSYVKTSNNVNIYDGVSSDAPIDTTQTNHFIYSENINAAYLTYSFNIRKLSFQAGLRAEQTITNGDQVTTGQTFSRNFFQLFPNISVSDSLSANNQLGLSVTRRIDRPTYQQLNPFSLYINPTFYLNGNPYLLPQNSYIAELSDGIKQQYFITFTYTHTQYPITTVIEPFAGRPNIVKQTEENLSSSDNYALNATVATQLTKWWNTTTSVDAYESHYVADIASSQLSTNRFIWDANTQNNITIGKKLSLELHGFYNSGYDLGYLFLKAEWGVGGGLQMKVLQNKGTIKLSATDVFWTNTTVGTTYFTGFNEYVVVKRDTRVVTLSFSYHFGGNSQSSLRSKGGAEDEKKRANTTG